MAEQGYVSVDPKQFFEKIWGYDYVGDNATDMVLADSVPGVSGGTVAFIMGFYDQFIGPIHNLAFGKMKEKHSDERRKEEYSLLFTVQCH